MADDVVRRPHSEGMAAASLTHAAVMSSCMMRGPRGGRSSQNLVEEKEKYYTSDLGGENLRHNIQRL